MRITLRLGKSLFGSKPKGGVIEEKPVRYEIDRNGVLKVNASDLVKSAAFRRQVLAAKTIIPQKRKSVDK